MPSLSLRRELSSKVFTLGAIVQQKRSEKRIADGPHPRGRVEGWPGARQTLSGETVLTERQLDITFPQLLCGFDNLLPA